MPYYQEPSPEDVQLLKSICTQAEIEALTRALNYDLLDVLRADDATLSIFTHPRHALLRADIAKVHQRLKFELGISRVVNVEKADVNLKKKYHLRLIPGPCTNRSYLRYYTLMAAAIIESHLRKNK